MRRLLTYPRTALCGLLLLWLLPSLFIINLEMNNAPEAYFPEDAPAVLVEQGLRERFPEAEVIIALFEGEGLYEPAFLTNLHSVVLELEAHPMVERVNSVTTADHIRGTEDGFSVERLIDPFDLEAMDPAAWRERVVADRFAPGLLASRDGAALSLIVRPHELSDSLQRLELQRAVASALETAGVSKFNTAMAGHIALDVAQLETMVIDTLTFMPLTTGLGLLLLWLMFRRWLVVVLAVAAISAVVSTALGALALLGMPYTLVSSLIAPFLTAVTVAMLVHLFTAISHNAQRGLPGVEGVHRAVNSIIKPTLFTALTTSAGLLSLLLSPIRPIASFGLVSAIGVAVAAFIVLVLMPPLLVRWDNKAWPRSKLRWVARFANLLLRLAVRRAGLVVGLTIAALVIGIPQIRHVIVETDLYAFFKDDHPINMATTRVEEVLSGVMPMEVVFSGEQTDSMMEPVNLEAIWQLQQWLEQRPEVDYSASTAEMVGQMHWAFHGEDAAYFSVPDNRPLISQYLLIYDGADLHDLVDRNFQISRLAFNLNIHGARELNGFMTDLRVHLAENPPAGLAWDIAGMGRLFADQEQLLIDGQLRSLFAVSIMIFLLMAFLWRSVTAAGLCMLPNLAPVLIIFICMGVFGIWLDVATAMIASVAIGIAVDDTIHTYHGYSSRRRQGATVVRALARTYRQTGRAVIATTIVLAGQFVILAFSGFQPVASFGLLTAMGLIAALLFDLLLLPSLLVLGRNLGNSKRLAAKTVKTVAESNG